MKEFRELAERSRLNSLLDYILWGEGAAGGEQQDPETAVKAFRMEMEALYPEVSRDDRFQDAVVRLTAAEEEAYFKAGFLAGFALAEEIRGANGKTH